MIVYFNGQFLPKEEVRISPDDRGFLLGDGIYDATPCYDGRFLALDRHLRRMRNGVDRIRIAGADVEGLETVCHELIRRNELGSGNALLYKQITRGVAPRTHAFPTTPVPPTVYAYATKMVPKFDPSKGVAAITVPDRRWSRCDIKGISLLANCLANQQAQESGAFEAILVRDGVAWEGTHTALGLVKDGAFLIGPQTHYLLPSITRELVVDLCAKEGIEVRELPLEIDLVREASEVILMGTTSEVLAVVKLDGNVVGTGSPGPVSRRLLTAFKTMVRALQ